MSCFSFLHPATRRTTRLQPGGAVRGGAERHRWDFCHVPVQSPDPAEWIRRSGNVSHTADRESHFTSARSTSARSSRWSTDWLTSCSGVHLKFIISKSEINRSFKNRETSPFCWGIRASSVSTKSRSHHSCSSHFLRQLREAYGDVSKNSAHFPLTSAAIRATCVQLQFVVAHKLEKRKCVSFFGSFWFVFHS